MKIAIDIREASGEKTGKGFYTLNIVQNLLALDKKNSYVLYTKNKIPGFSEYKNAKVKVIKTTGLLWHFSVMRDCKKEGINRFFSPTSYIIPAFISRKIQTIFTVHDLIAILYPKNHNRKAVLIEKLLLKRALKRAHKVIAVSQCTKNDIMKIYHTPAKKLLVIYNAAAPDFKKLPSGQLAEFRKQTNLPPKFFLAVGTIIPRKNYLRLLKAYMEFRKKHPEYHLVIIGGKGWGSEEIFQLIQKNHLSQRVHTLGYLSNTSLVKIYNLASALIFPSLYEGFGIPILEAMQVGCPVIAANNSSIPEVVGDSAIMINAEDINSIVKGMNYFVTNKDIRHKLMIAGPKQAKQFSWSSSAKKLQKALFY